MRYGRISSHDWELLSAYLDGQLTNDESARLKERLESDPDLSAAFTEIGRTRVILRSAPKARAPRNYMLQPHMVKRRANREVPFFKFFNFSFASAVTGLLLLVLLVSDLTGIIQRVVPSVSLSDTAAPMAVEMMSEPALKEVESAPAPAEMAPLLETSQDDQVGIPPTEEEAVLALEMEEPESDAQRSIPEEEVVEEMMAEDAAEAEDGEMMGAASAGFDEPAGGGDEPPQLNPSPTEEAINTAADVPIAEPTEGQGMEVAAEPQIAPTAVLDEEFFDQQLEAESGLEGNVHEAGNPPGSLGLFAVRLVEVALAAMTIVFLAIGWIFRRQRG